MTGSGEDEGLVSALRRFPTHAAQIRHLIERNENFRAMCDDLAVAERALLSVDQLPTTVRDERRIEFTQMVDSLAAEIERSLGLIKVAFLAERLNK